MLEAPTVISINSGINFANIGDKIWIPITKVLLHVDVGDLAKSKKQRDWVALNSVLIPPFLTEDAILDGETAAKNLLKVFKKCIYVMGTEEEVYKPAYK